MVDLGAKTPCAGLLPLEVGGAVLRESDLGRLTSIAPFNGRQAELDAALRKAHGVGFPAPNTSEVAPSASIFWFGRDMALLAGPKPDVALSALAALTDQSDAWASVVLEGARVEDVLSRLVPVDLRLAHFAVGDTCRTLLGHMNVAIVRLGNNALQVLVFRSMVVTMVEEIHEAMHAVAARDLRAT